MSLISCKECNKEISDSAKSCPNCGAPNMVLRVKNKKLIIAVTISIAVVAIITAIVISKRYSKPADMSDDVYKLGLKALDITDDYLDGALTDDEAYDKLDNVLDSLDDIGSEALGVSVYVFGVHVDVLGMGLIASSTTRRDVVESRNELAEVLNQKKR